MLLGQQRRNHWEDGPHWRRDRRHGILIPPKAFRGRTFCEFTVLASLLSLRLLCCFGFTDASVIVPRFWPRCCLCGLRFWLRCCLYDLTVLPSLLSLRFCGFGFVVVSAACCFGFTRCCLCGFAVFDFVVVSAVLLMWFHYCLCGSAVLASLLSLWFAVLASFTVVSTVLRFWLRCCCLCGFTNLALLLALRFCGFSPTLHCCLCGFAVLRFRLRCCLYVASPLATYAKGNLWVSLVAQCVSLGTWDYNVSTWEPKITMCQLRLWGLWRCVWQCWCCYWGW